MLNNESDIQQKLDEIASNLHDTIRSGVAQLFTSVWDTLVDIIILHCELQHSIATVLSLEDEETPFVFGMSATFRCKENRLPSAVSVLLRDYQSVVPEYVLKVFIDTSCRLNVSFYANFLDGNQDNHDIDLRRYFAYPLGYGIILDNFTIDVFESRDYIRDKLETVVKEITTFLYTSPLPIQRQTAKKDSNMLAVQKWLSDINTHYGGDLLATLDKLHSRYGINYKLYQDSVILNYDLRNCSYPDDDIVYECRGLQLALHDFSVVSRAFRRFLNYGERNTTDIVFDSQSTVYGKIDGSLVILYYSSTKSSWQVRTRGTAFAEEKVSSIHGDLQKILETSPITFRDLILSAMKVDDLHQLNTSSLSKEKSYVFELVSPENRVITSYPERKLYYLSTFNNTTGEEYDYDDSYAYISRFVTCAMLPRYSFSGDMQDVLKMSCDLPASEEGYVVRNSKNERVKIKNPAYVALHLLHNNGSLTDKRILELMEIGEDSEFLSYFPDEQYKFDRLKESKEKLFAQVEKTYQEIKDIENQKDYAAQATQYKYSGLLFQLRKGLTLEQVWANHSLSAKEKLLLTEC